ncbi:MAG: rRNA ((1402)-N(4))-methyltransferase RsmH [Bacteroidota bacterium]
MSGSEYHKPVMPREVIESLNIRPDGVYVDVTFGGGGHSGEILSKLETGRLIAFDQDPDAWKNAPDDKRFTLVQTNFRNLTAELKALGIQEVNGILADLGVSSHQFDTPERGFSLRFDGPLDMRMDTRQKKSAWNVINEYDIDDISRILAVYGEMPRSRSLADVIGKSRPIDTVEELKKAVARFAPFKKEHKFYAQLFQALRIEVNDELKALEEFLEQTPGVLAKEGRLVIISYHSLEDRLVKNYMRAGNFSGREEKDLYGHPVRPLEPLFRKALVPDDTEINENNRSRSAKLRAATRL